MDAFNINDGLCFIALSYAIDESQVLGFEMNSQAYFDYIATRKIEIWHQLQNKQYRFSEFQK